MKKSLLGLLLLTIVCSLNIANANGTDCRKGKGTVPTTTYAKGIVYGCDGNIPIITIYGQNADGDDVGITIKSMNEGTGIIKIGTGEEAYGSFYQWGNNYPFPSDKNIYITSIMTGDKIDASGYGPNNYYSESTRYGGAPGGFWDVSNNQNLWGGRGDSVNKIRGFNTKSFSVINKNDRQAICPIGYHIPSQGERNALLYLWGKNYDTNQRTSLFTNRNLNDLNGSQSDWPEGIGNRFRDDLLLPFAGYRRGNEINTQTRHARYWSSSNYEIQNARSIRVTADFLTSRDDMLRSHALSVRCFKDTFILKKDHNNEIQDQIEGPYINEDINEDISEDYSGDIIVDGFINLTKGCYIGKGFKTNSCEGDNSSPDDNVYTQSNKRSDELQQAYDFAFKNGITTANSIDNADMNGGLTRIAMAKMLSQYAINILGKTPDTSKTPNFSDVSIKMDTDYSNGTTLAYQLGIMGMGLNKFRPYDTVTRAEFGTALSRMLFGLSDGNDYYYSTHLAKLKSEGIINNDNPNLKEQRGYVMLMLMRSAK